MLTNEFTFKKCLCNFVFFRCRLARKRAAFETERIFNKCINKNK